MNPKIVIDTNVIVAALKSKRGASNKLLQLMGTNRFISSISVALLLEYEAVIKRLFPDLSPEAVNDLLNYICATSEHARIYYLWRPVLRDPADNMVLELAIASEAKYIITYNQKDFKASAQFGVKAITSKELLELIGELS